MYWVSFLSFENQGDLKAILDVEMSIPAQMVYDVELAVKQRGRIETYLRSGGEIVRREEIIQSVHALIGEEK